MYTVEYSNVELYTLILSIRLLDAMAALGPLDIRRSTRGQRDTALRLGETGRPAAPGGMHQRRSVHECRILKCASGVDHLRLGETALSDDGVVGELKALDQVARELASAVGHPGNGLVPQVDEPERFHVNRQHPAITGIHDVRRREKLDSCAEAGVEGLGQRVSGIKRLNNAEIGVFGDQPAPGRSAAAMRRSTSAGSFMCIKSARQ